VDGLVLTQHWPEGPGEVAPQQQGHALLTVSQNAGTWWIQGDTHFLMHVRQEN
jgi:hypothetical protein